MNPIIKTLTVMAEISIIKLYGANSEQAQAVATLIKEQKISELNFQEMQIDLTITPLS